MHSIEALIPIFAILGAFSMIFGIVYLRTRENLAMLEKGRNPRTPRPYRSLKTGLLMIGSGLGLLIGYLSQLHDNPFFYFSLVAIGGGLGLVLSYIIERKAIIRGEDTE